MPIDFHCPTCGKLLRVPDESAGKQARCPHCGDVAVVPFPGAALAERLQPLGGQPFPGPQPGASGSFQPDASNPFASPAMASDNAPFDPSVALDWARNRIFAPALSLMITSALGCLVTVLYLIRSLSGLVAVRNFGTNPEENVGFVVGYCIPFTASLVLLIVIFVGAWQMKNLRSYGLSMTAAILSLLPCNCCFLLTIPFGIWALIVLVSDEVKWAFEQVGRR